MSTKTNTNTANQYNPSGMSAYNSLIPQFASTTSALMSSPLNNSMFQNQLSQAQNSANQVNQRNIANSTSNLRTGGGLLGQGGAFTTASINNAMLSGSTNTSNAFNSTLGSALQNRNFALQSAEGFNPLQTGSNTTQTKSGLGTWLPQVAGAALGAATGGFGGLLGSAAGSLGNTGPGSLAAQYGTQQASQSAPYNYGPNPLAGASSGGGAMPWNI